MPARAFTAFSSLSSILQTRMLPAALQLRGSEEGGAVRDLRLRAGEGERCEDPRSPSVLWALRTLGYEMVAKLNDLGM